MKGIFHYDGWLAQILNRVADALILGTLWIVFSIPVLTIGAATSALYYSTYKLFREKEARVLHIFWSAFKSNLKQSSILWGIMILVGSFAIASCYYGLVLFFADALNKVLLIILCVCDVLAIAWLCYLLPYAARFNATTGRILRNSAVIMLMNLIPSAGLVAILIIACLAIMIFPILLFVAPVLGAWISSFILDKVFGKYMVSEALTEQTVSLNQNPQEE